MRPPGPSRHSVAKNPIGDRQWVRQAYLRISNQFLTISGFGWRSFNSLWCILGLVFGTTLFEVNDVELTLIVLSNAGIKGCASIFVL
jgi:hypothetical protein